MIREIESLLNDKIQDEIIGDRNPERLNISQSIYIYDNFGTEEMDSIDDYSLLRFSDNTRSISIHYEIWDSDQSLFLGTIKIHFSTWKSGTYVDIRCYSERPRRKASNIFQMIKELTEKHRNDHYRWHEDTDSGSVVWFLAYVSFLLSIILLINRSYVLGILFILIAVTYYLFQRNGKQLHPYSMFDNPINHEKLKLHEIRRQIEIGIIFCLLGIIGAVIIMEFVYS